MEKKIIYSTASDRETMGLGRRLGRFLKNGDVIALSGPLGSGKTWFTKGIALGLGVRAETVVTSPSFALVNEYEGRSTFYHMDFYRLEQVSDVFSAGLEDYLQSDGVVVVEWADRWPQVIEERAVWVRFQIIDRHRRKITLSGCHKRSLAILNALEKADPAKGKSEGNPITGV